MDLVSKLLLPKPKHEKYTPKEDTLFHRAKISALSLHMSVTGYKLHVDRESAENIQVTKHSIKPQLMNRPSTKYLQKNNVYAEYSNKFQKKIRQ